MLYQNGKLIYNNKYKNGKHVIYGYLQLYKIIKVNEITGSNWYDDYPHARRKSGNDNV